MGIIIPTPPPLPWSRKLGCLVQVRELICKARRVLEEDRAEMARIERERQEAERVRKEAQERERQERQRQEQVGTGSGGAGHADGGLVGPPGSWGGTKAADTVGDGGPGGVEEGTGNLVCRDR